MAGADIKAGSVLHGRILLACRPQLASGTIPSSSFYSIPVALMPFSCFSLFMCVHVFVSSLSNSELDPDDEQAAEALVERASLAAGWMGGTQPINEVPDLEGPAPGSEIPAAAA